jgi:hypothetical protein
MRRILLILLFLTLILLGASYLMLRGGEFSTILKQGENIVALTLTILEIIGIALAIVLAALIIVQYIFYLRPRHFVFEGFSNAETLTSAEQFPLNINALAQERLLQQCAVMYRSLLNFPLGKQKTEKIRLDTRKLLADIPFSTQNFPSNDEFSMEDDIAGFLALDMLIDDQAAVANRELTLCTREMVESLQEQNQVNLMSLMGEIAPEQISPLAKLINAAIPPHIIKANAHFQYSRDEKSGLNRPGITIEIVNVRNQHRIALQTIWGTSNEIRTAIAASPGVPRTRTKAKMAIRSQEKSFLEPTPKLTIDHYIHLLKPAICWLTMLFMEQHLISHVPPINHFLRWREPRRKAQLHYVLGILYYASAYQYPMHKDFFWEQAVGQFHQITIEGPNWCEPYLYLANIYSFQMHQSEATTESEHQNLLDQAMDLYRTALAVRDCNASRQKPLDYRIIIAQAWTQLISHNPHYQAEGIATIEKVSVQLENDVLKNVSQRESYAPALYNLAAAYITMLNENKPVVDGWKKARYYLTYALVCSWDLRDTIERVMDDYDTSYYIQALEEILWDKVHKISKLPGKILQEKINTLEDEAKKLMDRKLRQER